MADVKRKRSLRESTIRGTPKRHESAKGVAAKSATPVEPPQPEAPAAPAEEEVPTSFEPHGPLPFSKQLQDSETLPSREWKTISESAVLQTAFERSRDVWLSGRMFDRYWAKPSKKKFAVVDAKNPPKDSMVKIGECMISIHPHVFEAKLYTVRDREKERQRELEFQQQQEQYQAQLGQMPKQPHSGRPGSYKPALLPKPNSQSNGHQNGHTNGHTNSHTNGHTNGHANGHARQHSNGASPPPAAPQHNPGPDPVIQLLATRASNDPTLKALMRVVASGQANQEQLAAFQAHIDELTPLARASAAAKAQRAALAPQSPSPPPQTAAASSPTNGAPTAPRPTYQAIQPAGPVPDRPTQTPQPVAPRPSITVLPKPKQLSLADRKHLDIKDVVFEFSIATIGDRYYIPRKSIIEYRHNKTELLLSYLYVSTTDQTFQPITITINAPTPKTLEPIARVVEDPATVRAYMKEIMATYTRANHGYLLMRLKRDEAEIRAAQEAEARRLKEEEEAKKRLAKAATAAAAAAEEMMYQEILRGHTLPKPTTSIVKAKKKSHLILENGGIALDLPKTKIKTKYSRKGRVADPSKNCHLCGTNKTSLWRRAEIDGETVVVCNACGIKWKTNQDKKERGEAPLEYGPRMSRPKNAGGVRTGKVAAKSGKLIQAIMESKIHDEPTRVEPVEASETITLSGTHQLTPDIST
ncbi:hypothetical protein Dda_3118 [Drechslerella dactyloides]|uniref:GATA-type domain-containing protein n=1 Tax=Drechslerella dactyloides TaxID=74499 RepID=A0AAD6J1C9_DREDA|nr:hypothetical protein Dda_3118 [Drechslerella dactyloides]